MEEFTFGAVKKEEKDKVEELLTIDKNALEPIALTELQTNAIADLKNKIDIHDTLGVMNYGASEQAKLSKFSDQTLNRIKSHQLSDVGDVINNLVKVIDGFDPTPKKDTGFLNKLFKKDTPDSIVIEFEELDSNVQKIVNTLETHYLN